ncbi:hypothetical protein BIV57_16025 [Mangrovactinospora gilvigrisea]|uniref:DUF742 domain-containing protein n=1 Tax=Mangrovactinospora gilvigrisea TaxID=1428644 RepID=A0A1J7C4I3_9ACTN|nr:DUF742 domain-containing protein [Mangrovactinospora gilvigrisea]OIV36472.1 hypothetical protein BIV57_16025 [Mangrovactinospora gilvigrisea]
MTRPPDADGDGPAEDAGGAEAMFVRPFIMTGGRARPTRAEVRLETLVLAAPGASDAPLEFEERRLVELCSAPVSVAELAARTRIPFGVAKVLVSDLMTSGLLVSRQAEEPHELPLDLIERIRDHVRSL